MNHSVSVYIHSVLVPRRCISANQQNIYILRHLSSSSSGNRVGGSGKRLTKSCTSTYSSPSALSSNTPPSTSKSQRAQQPNLLNSSPSLGRDDASLARYPNLYSAGGILRGLDYAGTATFALTGSVTAAQSGLDVFGCTMAGVITAVGGGTIRDAIFLNRKPFWTEETEYIYLGLFTGIVTFFAWPSVLEWQKEHKKETINKKRRIQEEQNKQSTISLNEQQQEQTDTDEEDDCYDELDGALDTLDAIGLSTFAIIGAQNGVRAGMPMLVSAICGMATSTFGGLTRDVLCGRPIRIVHSNAEVYAPPALVGATIYLAAKRWGASPAMRIWSSMGMCMGSRFIAIKNDVKVSYLNTMESC